MAGPAEATQETRIKNVGLHRRGHQENGTLYLKRHHLIFSYHPSTKPSISSAAHGHQRGASGQYAPALSTESSTSTTAGTGLKTLASPVPNDSSKPQGSEPKARPKEMYIPYPIIHHCTLRPSHAVSAAVKPLGLEQETTSREDDDDNLFPPTFGTSSSVRPSTDSARLSAYGTPQRTASPTGFHVDSSASSGSGRSPAIRLRCKDFSMLAFHFNPCNEGTAPDDAARQTFYILRDRCCVDKVEDLYAFDFRAPSQERVASGEPYDARREFSRMGISPKAADGPGAAWRITDINHDYEYSSTYPSVLCIPRAVSDNMLKYGGSFRSKSRIPALAYLHPNGGSITRASQPLVGFKGRRNPQDERLVSAIFSSHTPPLLSPEDSPVQLPSLASPSTTTLDLNATGAENVDADVSGLEIDGKIDDVHEISDDEKSATPPKPKVYGSTRRNLIVDARPYVNMTLNKVTGGGIEDVAHYVGHDMPTEKVFLDIANIHEMRSSLDTIVKSFGNADYVDLPPNQETLRKSGWLKHITGVLDGAEKVARVVGLGGSHVLIHCSDGWDRTSQVSALAQLMIDPHYRTLDGYITLVQKDFLSFGHKFRDRNGIEGCEDWFEIENERIQPSRRQNGGSESNNLQNLGSKALSGAKTWFEKSRGSLFRQPNGGESPSSRPASPPPNPLIHSPPSAREKKAHKMDPREVSPIFHQFLDATFQLLHQAPKAFEFNERFLRRLFYQVYAGQYGEFLFNNERERSQHPKLPSAWGHFLSRRAEFVNPDFVAKTDDPLLFPQRKWNGTEGELILRWWNGLFGRKEEEMNVPRALAPPDPPALPAQTSSLSYDESAAARAEGGLSPGAVRPTKSTPNLTGSSSGEARDDVNSLSSAATHDVPSSSSTARPPLYSKETDNEILSKYVGGSSTAPVAVAASPRPSTEQFQMVNGDETDPLGGMTATTRLAQSGRLDFAAFAQGSAFRDR